jgi:MinD-like ATPase involved in chromosome partitioning or flagellar assembly
MAMVNVAVELVSQGSTVVMVDFDVEAPGLDTFRVGKTAKESKGIVDFVSTYLTTGEVPDVREYVYQAHLTNADSGALWVMPAGLQDNTYDSRFKAIDWKYLYGEQDGFLLFEDLKGQWREILQADYVLIDSRTGHTDVGGICTRQLPDAVVIFFFPNEQNRRGLQSTVEAIRGEEKGPLRKSIKLHFVMSNVPDLDDEEEILAANVARLQQTLKYEELASTIHHYDSLLLLNQTIFSLERPRSRLAQEYRLLTKKIRRSNLRDREGALEFLEEVGKQLRSRHPRAPLDLDKQLHEIFNNHSRDGEILRLLARLRRRQRKWAEAIAVLDQTVALGVIDSDILLMRAELYWVLGNREAALFDVRGLLQLSEAAAFDLQVAVRLLVELKGDATVVAESQAIDALDPHDRRPIIQELESSPETLLAAERLIQRILDTSVSDEILSLFRCELMLCLIGEGKFAQALVQVSPHEPTPDDLDMYDAFNYAMALWAETSVIPFDWFRQITSLHSSKSGRHGANYHQCIAIAFWATGELDKAFQQSKEAYETMARMPDRSFSCWSYLFVETDKFMRDIGEMDRMFNGQPVLPEYMVRAGLQFVIEFPRPPRLQ